VKRDGSSLVGRLRRAPASRGEGRSASNEVRDAAAGHAGNHAVTEAMTGGTPLDPDVRADMEARFGTDFADVRVHDHETAHGQAVALEARAFTVGDDIAFGPGAYEPHSPVGRRLLAHELAHVVQQRRGGPEPALSHEAPHERAADAAATQVASGAASVHVPGGTGVGLARAPVPAIEDPEMARRRELSEREALERGRQEREHAAVLLSFVAFRRREYQFGRWYARMSALEPGVVYSATYKLLGRYGFGYLCKVNHGFDDYLRDFDRAVALWAAATDYRYVRREALHAPIFDPEGEAARMDQVILDELPDGTGYIGRRQDFLAMQEHQIKERNARVMQNITANVFGAIGWGHSGEKGSEAGAAFGEVVTGGRGKGRGPVKQPRTRRSSTSRTTRDAARVRRTAKSSKDAAKKASAPAPDVAPPVLGGGNVTAQGGAGAPGANPPAAGGGAAADPLVVIPVQGKQKGKFWREGTTEFKKHAGSSTKDGRPKKPPSRTHIVLPESEARRLGFREASEPATSRIEPRRIGGLQVESSGAGRTTEHPITARTTRKSGRSTGPDLEAPKENPSAQHAFDRTIKADLAQGQGHNALMDRGELGLLRANNVSTRGVDSITAVIDSNGKARIYLNDFTSPGTRKGGKDTHAGWGRELRDATTGSRLDFGGRQIGGVKVEDAIRTAIENNEVYVRAVHVSLPAEAGPGPRPRAGTAQPSLTLGEPIRLKKGKW
jgi:hypothetical protein